MRHPSPFGSSRPARASSLPADAGTSLVEALVVAALLCAALSGVAPLLLWSRRAIWGAGTETMAVVLAAQKLEQLRTLDFHVLRDGTLAGDESTDLSGDEPAGGGTGLRASPAGTLDSNVAGFVDYLDSRGGWRGGGVAPPAGSAFVRRWALVPFPPDPRHAVVLRVFVAPLAELPAAGSTRHGVHLTTIRSRGVP